MDLCIKVGEVALALNFCDSMVRLNAEVTQDYILHEASSLQSFPNVSPASCFTAALLGMVLKGLGDSRPNHAMGQKWISAVTIDVEADALRSRLWSHSHHILAAMQFSLQGKLKVQILFQHSARKLPGLLLELSLMTGPNLLALTLLQQGLLG